MSNLNVKLKKILEDLEQNINNKEDLEYIKVQIFNMYNIFFDEINRIEENTTKKLDQLAGTEAALQDKILNLENKLKSMEEELFIEDDDSEFGITCPYCNTEFFIDTDELKDEIECPECNNIIELDWGEEESGCSGCGHGCCGHHKKEDEDDM